jgi:hypothetical protein
VSDCFYAQYEFDTYGDAAKQKYLAYVQGFIEADFWSTRKTEKGRIETVRTRHSPETILNLIMEECRRDTAERIIKGDNSNFLTFQLAAWGVVRKLTEQINAESKVASEFVAPSALNPGKTASRWSNLRADVVGTLIGLAVAILLQAVVAIFGARLLAKIRVRFVRALTVTAGAYAVGAPVGYLLSSIEFGQIISFLAGLTILTAAYAIGFALPDGSPIGWRKGFFICMFVLVVCLGPFVLIGMLL